MSKSKKSPKGAKKSAKPVKAKKAAPKPARPSGGKKAKLAKPAKKAASKKSKPVKKVVKPARPSGGKAVKKTALKKVVKKASKPVKKDIKSAKKVVKPVKKASKPAKPVKNIAAKPAAKPLKKSGKIEVMVVNTKKASKPVKPVKAPKPSKEEKSKGGKKAKEDDFFPVAGLPPKVKSKAGRKPKSKNDDDEPEIINDELIEQLIQSTKKKKSGPKVPKIIKTFVNPMASLAVASDEMDKKVPKKEPKGKFELEYVIRTSAGILYELISTPSGLSEWFSDDVNIRDGYFTFFWDGSEQRAKLLGFKEEKFIRLRWVDKPEGSYFEFRIERDELTGDISLIITDFADEASDQQTSKLLWDSQVNKLLGVLGSN